MKKLKWIVLILLAVIVVAVVVVLMNLNSIIRSTVEKQSTASLKVPTTLGAASISIFSGDVSLQDYNVGSPAGYKAPQMLSLGELAVNTSWSGLRSDPLRVDTIDIDKPKLVLEMVGTDFNIKKFIDNLPKSDEPETPADGETEPLKLIIGKFTVKGASVVLRPDAAAVASLPGGIGEKLASQIKPEYTLTFPDFDMENVGTADGNQNGVAVKEVVTQLITTLASKASQSPDLPEELRVVLSGDLSNVSAMLQAKGMAVAQKELGKITDDLKGKLQKELGTDVTNKVTDVLKNPTTQDAGKAVTDLLGGLGKKKEDKK